MFGYESLNTEQAVSETDPFTEERYELFHKFLPKHTRFVLDIGCNTGRGGTVLKTLNQSLAISGLDIVEDRLQRLPADTYARCYHGSSTAIPCEDCIFDAVVAGEFIEHLYPHDVDRTLSEMFRVLNVGGRLLLTTPNPCDIKRKLRHQSILGGAHLSQHHPGSLKARLLMTGFSDVRILGCGRVTRYLGCKFPCLFVYGSYLAIGTKY